ncbi:MAG: class I SAM-dependent methyltransferase [Flammeovirgaceae bacterium]
MKKKEWFAEWFNSPFYHILYKHRDNTEAQIFMKHLIDKLKIEPQHKIMDVGCGKGRHAIFLNQLGLEVLGVDLSPENIMYAQQFANERLTFAVHDMRMPYPSCCFDFIFNLFTSFGYFDTDEEHVQAIRSISSSLKKGGILVIDFFNTYHILNTLPQIAEKTEEGVCFKTIKYLEKDFIIKDIEITCHQQKYYFQEKVKALTEDNFLYYFSQTGLKVKEVFGDYQLNAFEKDKSDRMIWILEK